MKTIDELNQERNNLEKAKKEALYQSALIVLNLVQSLADEGFTIKMSGWISECSIDFGFDRGEKSNFGLDFSIRWNSSLETIELNHSIGLSADKEYMKEVKPFIVQRDKIIAKLWEHEDLLAGWFVGARAINKSYSDKIIEIGNEIDYIKEQERNNILKRLVVGTCLKWAGCDYTRTIIKITPQRITLDSGVRLNKFDLVCSIQGGNIQIVGGQQ